MPYVTRLLLVVTSLPSFERELCKRIQQVMDEHRPEFEEIILTHALQEVSPMSVYELEMALADAVRELARELIELTLNQFEPEDPEDAPHHVVHEGGGYRRCNDKTPNRRVATLFGTIELWRRGYRYWHRDEGEKSIFPLEMQLGLVHGATPALAKAACRYLAEAGATQAAVLARLKHHHNVSWGAGRLRDVAQSVAKAMEELRQEYQAQKILRLLKVASQSAGGRKPVLAVGRDGISLCEYRHRFWEVATTGTVTVYDRKGNRLGTVYLALPPELGQQEMSGQLTALIKEILRRWEGPLPRLAYITDAGDNETRYYREVLRKMRHPRTDERLEWCWIVDYYHASERIWTMAEVLFGRNKDAGRAWARRMCRVLKKPNGPSRVLHSAAALYARRTLSQERDKEYHKAYNYIRKRTKFMQYAQFKKQRLPIGSGVTEAACKTVFTQRLKLSGMRWEKEGARTILSLRVVLLSQIWDDVYSAYLTSYNPHEVVTYEPNSSNVAQNAA